MKNLYLFYILTLFAFGTQLMAQDLYLYVSDAGNFNSGPWQIVRYDPNGENPIVFIDENLAWPQDILFLEDRTEVLVSSLSSGRITRHHANTGAFIDDFVIDTGGPTRMKIGPDGLIYSLQWTTDGMVQRYEVDGTPLGDYTNIGVTQSIGLDWDENNNLYISSYGGGFIRMFDDSGNDQGLFAETELSGPTNIEIVDGVMYVLDWTAGKVFRYDVETASFMDEFITGLTNPEGLAFLPNGDILIGDNGTNSVRRFSSTGEDLGDYTIGGGLLTPNAAILRDAKFLSNEDQRIPQVLVSPTIGNRFEINPSLSQDIVTLQIFNITGKLIESIDLSATTSINAKNYQEGIYFIVATTTTNKKHTQKVLVKK